MTAHEHLDNLLRTGLLKAEPSDPRECEGLLRSAVARLQDAHQITLSFDSRFDLAYNAAHALALTALRLRGYRSDKRYLVFQCLAHTLGVDKAQVRIFALCHERRNHSEYEGYMNVDEKLLTELLAASDALLAQVRNLTEKFIRPD